MNGESEFSIKFSSLHQLTIPESEKKLLTTWLDLFSQCAGDEGSEKVSSISSAQKKVRNDMESEICRQREKGGSKRMKNVEKFALWLKWMRNISLISNIHTNANKTILSTIFSSIQYCVCGVESCGMNFNGISSINRVCFVCTRTLSRLWGGKSL